MTQAAIASTALPAQFSHCSICIILRHKGLQKCNHFTC
ncbi:hypothetical protein RR11_797 [Ruegeria sp. R11]|nr:hypothetical protein RR11_797 [Ruegeria sp. R11]